MKQTHQEMLKQLEGFQRLTAATTTPVPMETEGTDAEKKGSKEYAPLQNMKITCLPSAYLRCLPMPVLNLASPQPGFSGRYLGTEPTASSDFLAKIL